MTSVVNDNMSAVTRLGRDSSSSEENQAPNVKLTEKEKAKPVRVEGAATKAPQVDSSLLQSKITELETALQSTEPEEREAAKARRKLFRETQKMLTDKSLSTDEKLRSLLKRFVSQVAEQGRTEKELIPLRRKYDTVVRERDESRGELQKCVVVKDKLQELCRELQKENKRIVEESRKMAEEEQLKRQQLSDRFETTVKDIAARLDEHSEERVKQNNENEALREKLKALLEQYDLREQHFERQLHAKGLELQLCEAKLAQQTEISSQLTAQLGQFQQQLELRNKREAELQSQLEQYAGKFEEFQETVTKSNEMFEMLKKDTQKYAEAVLSVEKEKKALEKQRNEMKVRCDKLNVSLVQLMGDNDNLKQKINQQCEEAAKMKLAKERLEGLCRALQKELKTKSQAASSAEDVTAGQAANGGAGESACTSTSGEDGTAGSGA